MRRRTLVGRPAGDVARMLQYALCMVLVMALAGCGTSGFSNGRNSDPEVQEPTCYRDAKSEYEAAGASRSPNAAMLNIAAGLASKDTALETCGPAVGGSSKLR